MVEDYDRQITKMGGTTKGKEGYGTYMHAVEYLTDGDFLTEAVTKYAERATQVGERMVHMEANYEEKISIMSM